MKKKLFMGVIAVLAALGFAIGYRLSSYTNLQPFKLLNIVGLFYDLLGIFVLSELIAKSAVVKKFIVHWVSSSLMWAQTVIPFGALLGSAFAYFYTLPSSGIAANFFLYFFGYSGLIICLIESTVFAPKLQWLQNIETRSHVFGLILLVSGIIIQIVAAFLDLNS